MNFIKEIPAMRWKEGKYEEVMEKTVQDENIVFHIDDLPPRKFSTYPEDLDESSQSSSNSADAGNAKELSLKKNMAVSGITAGNPLFALLLALAFIGLVPYKKE